VLTLFLCEMTVIWTFVSSLVADGHLQQLLGSLILYFGLAVIVYGWQRFRLRTQHSAGQVRKEIAASVVNLVLEFVCARSLWFLVHTNLDDLIGTSSRLPNESFQEGNLFGRALVLFLLLDFNLFFEHYLVHAVPAFYKFHKFHHQFVRPSPFATGGLLQMPVSGD
jgi:sterol desaturase/sphingolipid hydroxylase (fatty acid hydroxylase superfamily)